MTDTLGTLSTIDARLIHASPETWHTAGTVIKELLQSYPDGYCLHADTGLLMRYAFCAALMEADERTGKQDPDLLDEWITLGDMLQITPRARALAATSNAIVQARDALRALRETH